MPMRYPCLCIKARTKSQVSRTKSQVSLEQDTRTSSDEPGNPASRRLVLDRCDRVFPPRDSNYWIYISSAENLELLSVADNPHFGY